MAGWGEWLGSQPGIMLGGWLLAGAMAGWGVMAWVRRMPPGAPEGCWPSRLLAAALVCAALFATVAAALSGESGLPAFDDALAASLAAHASAALLHSMAWLTVLGDRNLLLAAGAGVLLILLWRRRWEVAGLWVAATAGAGLLNMALKAGFSRVRPEHLHGFAQAHGWSFPSGHATGSMAFYAMLAYLVLRAAPPGRRVPVAVVAGMLIATIGYTRVLLQVHYFSDVVAAWAVTGAWLLVCVAAAGWLRTLYDGRRA